MSEQQESLNIPKDKYRQHNMWTYPAKEKKPVYADIKITQELIDRLDDVPTPDREYVERQTAAFNVPLTPGTLDIIVCAHA